MLDNTILFVKPVKEKRIESGRVEEKGENAVSHRRDGGTGQLGPANWVPPTGSRRLGPRPTGSRANWVPGQLGPAIWVPSQKGPSGSQDLKIYFINDFHNKSQFKQNDKYKNIADERQDPSFAPRPSLVFLRNNSTLEFSTLSINMPLLTTMRQSCTTVITIINFHSILSLSSISLPVLPKIMK
jgi:hypothetical protein